MSNAKTTIRVNVTKEELEKIFEMLDKPMPNDVDIDELVLVSNKESGV
jgi:hypothetical protein